MHLQQRALHLAAALSLALAAFAGGPVVAAAPTAPNAGLVVNSLGDASDGNLTDPACQTATFGECTLRAAIEQANATAGADTITFNVVGVLPWTAAAPLITSTLTLAGPGAGVLKINANGTGPVLNGFSADPDTHVQVSGLTLTGGDYVEGGGLAFFGAGTLLISATVVTSNTAGTGGGLNATIPVTIINSVIAHNTATQAGGGIFANGQLDIDNSQIRENLVTGVVEASSVQSGPSGVFAGGLYAGGGLTLISSLVLSNTAVAPELSGAQPAAPPGPFGVGIYLYNTSATISNSVIAGNTALACITCPVTLAGGVGPTFAGQGGGLFADASGAYLVDTHILSNTAQVGGGVYLGDNSQVTFYDSRLAGNRAATAGGLYGSLSNVYVNTSTIVDNWATTGDGGGLYLYGGYASIDGSLIVANRAGGSGGGLYASGDVDLNIGYSQFERNASGQPQPVTGAAFVEPQVTSDEGGGLALLASDTEIFNSAIVSNTATLGGGISSAGPLFIINTTLSGNRANRDGGGLRLITPPLLAAGGADVAATADLQYVTLANNLADADHNTSGDGGGLFVTTGTTATLHNTLVALNADSGGQAATCAGLAVSTGYNLVDMTAGCPITATIGDQFNLAAGLQPLQNYGGGTLSHALAFASPARDAADPEDCNPQDQRNVPRPFGSRCDIGAFELTGLYIPMVTR